MVAEAFALLAALGYVAPWARDGSDQVAELAADGWRSAFAGASSTELLDAVRSWAAADTAGYWPKPGAVRAHLRRAPAAPVVLLEEVDERPEVVRELHRACEYLSVRTALWQGARPEDLWPVVDEADPDVQRAAEQVLARGWARSQPGAVLVVRQARAARRLLGARMLLERLVVEHPVPESSYAQILVDAVVHGGLYEPATTLDDVRAYLVRRIAEDPERVAHYERLRAEAERRLSAPEAKPTRTGMPVGSKLWARAQKLGEA